MFFAIKKSVQKKGKCDYCGKKDICPFKNENN